MAKLQVVRDDVGELERLEAVVRDGMTKWIEVSVALLEIHDRVLFRKRGFKTWSQYVNTTWAFGLSHANRLMLSGRAVENCAPGRQNLPEGLTEKAARELSRLKDPKDQRSAWREAESAAKSAGQKVTARLVREMVRQRLPEKNDNDEAIDTEGETVDDECVFDIGAKLSAIVNLVTDTLETWPNHVPLRRLTEALEAQARLVLEIERERSIK